MPDINLKQKITKLIGYLLCIYSVAIIIFSLIVGVLLYMNVTTYTFIFCTGLSITVFFIVLYFYTFKLYEVCFTDKNNIA